MTARDSAESDVQGYGFIETLFGFRMDSIRLLREHSVCVTCGKPGWHTHVTTPERFNRVLPPGDS